MTKRRAERLTGYEVRELPAERGLYTVGAFEGEQLVVKAVGRADFLALGALVQGGPVFQGDRLGVGEDLVQLSDSVKRMIISRIPMIILVLHEAV